LDELKALFNKAKSKAEKDVKTSSRFVG
jgi:hypothetical protein